MRWLFRLRYLRIACIYWVLMVMTAVGTIWHSSFAIASANQPASVTVAQAPTVKPYNVRNTEEKAVLNAFGQAAKKANGGSEPSTVIRLVVSGRYALLNWAYREMGGQTLLVKESGQWKVLRGVGGVISVDLMIQLGVPSAEARALAAKYETTYHESLVPKAN